jgi:hypothetical protein
MIYGEAPQYIWQFSERYVHDGSGRSQEQPVAAAPDLGQATVENVPRWRKQVSSSKLL